MKKIETVSVAKGTSVTIMKSKRTVVKPVQTIIPNPKAETKRNGIILRLNLWIKLNFFGKISHRLFIVSCKTPKAPIAPITVKTIVVIDVTIDVKGVVTVSRIC